MAVDMAQLQSIHRLETEVTDAERTVRELRQQRVEHIQDLPEYRTLEDALAVVRDAHAALKLAIRSDAELTKLQEELADAAHDLRDLREMLSHHLVAYHEDTGRDVVKDHEARTRQIELKAKLGKPAPDQARLPLGLDRHLGVRMEIGTKPEPLHLELPEVVE